MLIEVGSNTNAGITIAERGSGGTYRTIMSGGWNSQTNIYHAGSLKFNTQSDGAHVDGTMFADKFDTSATGSRISGANVSSGVTKVYCETGNDNVVKHGDAAAIKAFLGVGSHNRCRVTVLTTVGTGNFSTQSWCTHLVAIVNAGGGAGGNTWGTGHGGRGGHGGQNFNYREQLSGIQSIPYKVGSGGTRHTGGGSCDDAIAAGGSGDSSYFGPTSNRATATGGTGGQGAYANTTGANGTNGNNQRFFSGDYGQGGQGGTWNGGDGCQTSAGNGGGGAIWILELG